MVSCIKYKKRNKINGHKCDKIKVKSNSYYSWSTDIIFQIFFKAVQFLKNELQTALKIPKKNLCQENCLLHLF